jgi:3-hydroxybutyryl-CoA dehydrogenase
MVDIMAGSETSEDTFEKGKQWIKDIKCEPLVVKKECLGFVFNRIWHAVKKECLKIWDGGHADIETVDTAWKIFTGMKMGPFTTMDGIGLDVVYAVEMSYYNESGDPSDKPPDAFKEMVEKGDLGMKTGKGFYTYRRRKK